MQLKNSIIWKMMTWLLLLALIPLGVVVIFTQRQVTQTIQRSESQAIGREAHIFAGLNSNNPDTFGKLTQTFGTNEKSAFILGTDGTYLAHTNRQKIGTQAGSDFTLDTVQRILSGNEGTIDNTADSEIIGYAPIAGQNAVAVIIRDSQAMEVSLDALLNSIFLQLSVTLLITSFVSGLAIMVFIYPLRKLAEFADQLGSGNLDATIETNELEGEIAVLGGSLGNMADRLRELIGSLEQRIIERKVVEDALVESEAIFASFMEYSPVYIFFKDKEIRPLRLSNNYEQMLGMPISQMLGKTMDDLFPSELAKRMVEDDLQILNSGKMTEVVEEFNGRVYETVKFPIFKDGAPNMLAGFTVDVTERKQTEAEKEALQTQLLQAQKMESIGRLAGGMAHDFNNLLGVIMGHAETGLEKTHPSQAGYQDLQEIQKAARRSADLIRQLLAFARKQVIHPKVLDLNNTISEMLNMLKRIIGEDIQLVWRPGLDLKPVFIDPSQFDQVLVNLIVNARDAFTGVGKIVIETKSIVVDQAENIQEKSLASGEYTILSVCDSGNGMARKLCRTFLNLSLPPKKRVKGPAWVWLPPLVSSSRTMAISMSPASPEKEPHSQSIFRFVKQRTFP